MGKFVGLDGVTGEKDALRLTSVSGALQIIKAGGACGTAGDNGAVTAWRDDAGKYRAELSRWMSVKARIETKSLKGIREFLKEHLPTI